MSKVILGCAVVISLLMALPITVEAREISRGIGDILEMDVDDLIELTKGRRPPRSLWARAIDFVQWHGDKIVIIIVVLYVISLLEKIAKKSREGNKRESHKQIEIAQGLESGKIAKVAGEVIECPQCGKTNPRTANFCGSCGADMQSVQEAAQSPTSLPCPKCRAENSPDAKFCQSCGNSLSPAKQ